MLLKTLETAKTDRYQFQYYTSFYNSKNNIHPFTSSVERRNSLVKVVGLNNLPLDSIDSTYDVLLEKMQPIIGDENLFLDNISLIDGIQLEKIQPIYEKNLFLDNMDSTDGVLLEKIPSNFINNNCYVDIFYNLNKIDYYINDDIDDINVDKEIETFYELSKTDIIEDGIYSESERFINSIMKENFYLAMSILSKVCIKYFNQNNILISIFNIMSGLDHNIIDNMPYIKELVGSYLSSSDDLVIEQALKFFDNCGTEKDIDILNRVKPIKTKWIEDYRKEIIAYLSNK
ncbi:hypothetical protein [Brachyspira aalborgi]|uniref:hypothetical protein n=1 Tax=Brachyspira aalborgi TaxID=29522 RepID=UPI00266DCAC0|nr:hypothetical protein [Brachyspira aalborgi]